jgi:hypothetical protein
VKYLSKNNGKLLTLKEASNITGIAIPALRMRIKNGKIEGVKNHTRHGEAWFIKPDSIKEMKNNELNTLNVVTLKRVNSEIFNGETTMEKTENPVTNAKDEIIQGLKCHIKTYETLLATFQQRIQNLETERGDLEQKIKLLPAPPEILPSMLQQKDAMVLERDERIRALESVLQEKSLPWWQKIFRNR